MPTASMIVAVGVSGFALSLSPGPSMFYVLSRSVGQGRAAGLASALGLAAGGMFLAIAAALGLVSAFERWPAVLVTTQLLGGIYLAYLGVMALRDRGGGGVGLALGGQGDESFSSLFRHGFLVEALNPKTVFFLVAFLPQFVRAESGDPAGQLLVLGLLVPLTALPCDIAVSLFGGSIASGLRQSQRAAVVLNWAAGLILVALAVRIFVKLLV